MPGFFSTYSSRVAVSHFPQCGKCGLYQKCHSPKMEPTGRGVRKILFVAEAPGEHEDRRGMQLVGDAGQLLRRALDDACGIDLDDCWKTNAVICRPPKNRIEPYMIQACRANLFRTIARLHPKVIIVLGGSALTSILGGLGANQKDAGSISKWAGFQVPCHELGAWICPTYHPSYVLRMGEDKVLLRLLETHIRCAVDHESKTLPRSSQEDLERQVEIILSPRQARKRMAQLAKKKGILSFDYEATGLKPEREGHRIVSVSFCLNGEEAFACMVGEQEMRTLSKVLRNPRLAKVASNLKYEERWTQAKLGHGVVNWYWDTMLAAHVLDNRSGITSIKFQAFVYFGVGDYNSHIAPFLYSRGSNDLNQIDKIPPKDLLLYNGMDSLLEYMVMEKQKETFGDSI